MRLSLTRFTSFETTSTSSSDAVINYVFNVYGFSGNLSSIQSIVTDVFSKSVADGSYLTSLVSYAKLLGISELTHISVSVLSGSGKGPSSTPSSSPVLQSVNSNSSVTKLSNAALISIIVVLVFFFLLVAALSFYYFYRYKEFQRKEKLKTMRSWYLSEYTSSREIVTNDTNAKPMKLDIVGIDIDAIYSDFGMKPSESRFTERNPLRETSADRISSVNSRQSNNRSTTVISPKPIKSPRAFKVKEEVSDLSTFQNNKFTDYDDNDMNTLSRYGDSLSHNNPLRGSSAVGRPTSPSIIRKVQMMTDETPEPTTASTKLGLGLDSNGSKYVDTYSVLPDHYVKVIDDSNTSAENPIRESQMSRKLYPSSHRFTSDSLDS